MAEAKAQAEAAKSETAAAEKAAKAEADAAKSEAKAQAEASKVGWCKLTVSRVESALYSSA